MRGQVITFIAFVLDASMDRVLVKINKLNTTNGVVEYPRFHTIGVRTKDVVVVDSKGKEKTVTSKAHRWNYWDGAHRAKKLHCDRTFYLGSYINNYFLTQT